MSERDLPNDYLERVYAGVLGKLVGVYIGRPFEGWTYQRILKELGHVRYYVNKKLDVPLVVTDDDVSGTFIFVRGLEEHGLHPTAEDIGKTWLNNVIENQTIFWFGGYGISTEHTAFLNLKRGIPAPLSGSSKTNGTTVAEQIGAQIFIDGWGLVAPGNPTLAAQLAEAAGSVSHDGESVYAAKLWAAMEAEAFVSQDIDHLLDVGLGFVPGDSLIAKLIGDVRSWVKTDQDWEKTRQRMEDVYGYDKFHGACHVIPNHGIMIMALLYAGHDFHEAMHIINTSGWDTDCNSGNIGCLVAIINGLSSFEGGPDWRGPLADRAIISSADGGYSFNNAARITYDIVNSGRKLAGQKPLPTPKNAQYHFTLPGSVQGFQATHNDFLPGLVKVEQAVNGDHSGLAIRLNGLSKVVEPVEVLTQIFTAPENVNTVHQTYQLMASPLVYPGQKLTATVEADNANTVQAVATLRLKIYGPKDSLIDVDGPSVNLRPGHREVIDWLIPDDFDSQPIQKLGIVVSVPGGRLDGTVWLESLGWSGTPNFILRRPSQDPGEFWLRAWVNGVSNIMKYSKSFHVAQSSGEGILIHGTRDWTDYQVTARNVSMHIGGPSGIAIRVQGLNRYYALMFMPGNRVAIMKAKDNERSEIASADFEWKLDEKYDLVLKADGNRIKFGIINGPELEGTDDAYSGGGIGLVATNGSISAEQFEIGPVN